MKTLLITIILSASLTPICSIFGQNVFPPDFPGGMTGGPAGMTGGPGGMTGGPGGMTGGPGGMTGGPGGMTGGPGGITGGPGGMMGGPGGMMGGPGGMMGGPGGMTGGPGGMMGGPGGNGTIPVLENPAKDLHFDMKKWNYDAVNNVYYRIFVQYSAKPVAAAYETLGIFVSGIYMTGTANSDGTYTCTIKTDAKIGKYTAKTAPIVMPVNTPGYSAHYAPSSYRYNNEIATFLNAGYVYVDAGCRGRNNGPNFSGGAPWGVTDLKAAIRFLRYNAEILPGNKDAIFVYGHSGGGAQSCVLGASGNSKLYTPYLESIGALMKDDRGKEISDAIYGVMAWCPITSLDYSNEAYEWNMGQYFLNWTRSPERWTSMFSEDLAAAYADYINHIGLTDQKGNALKLEKSEKGIYAAGTYYDCILDIVSNSLTHFLTDNFTDVTLMKQYIASLNTQKKWVIFDEKTKIAKVLSMQDFAQNMKNATKSVGAFDDLNRAQAENCVFGNHQNDYLHWDSTMADLLKKNAEKYAEGDGFNKTLVNAFANDIKQVDDIGSSSQTRQDMYNPMYYIQESYTGYRKSDVAKHWRIRSGISQGDTAITVEANLALALNLYPGLKSIDFETVWRQGHTQAERKGNSLNNFILWIDNCMK